MDVTIDLALGKNYPIVCLKDKGAVVSVRKYAFGAHYVRYSHELSSENYRAKKVLHNDIEQSFSDYELKGLRDISVYYWNEDYELTEPLAICINERSDHTILFLRDPKSYEWLSVPVCLAPCILYEQNTRINGIHYVDISRRCNSGKVKLKEEREMESSNHSLYFKVYGYEFRSVPSLIIYKDALINVFPMHIENIVTLSVYYLSGKSREDVPLLINVVQRDKTHGSKKSFWFENTGQGVNAQWVYIKEGNSLSVSDILKDKLELLKKKFKGPDNEEEHSIYNFLGIDFYSIMSLLHYRMVGWMIWVAPWTVFSFRF